MVLLVLVLMLLLQLLRRQLLLQLLLWLLLLLLRQCASGCTWQSLDAVSRSNRKRLQFSGIPKEGPCA